VKHVQTFHKQFSAANTRYERDRIVNSVVDSVHANGGRFFFKDGASWYSLMDACWTRMSIHRVFVDATPK
jgi:predicted SpoU family rRNA methylase